LAPAAPAATEEEDEEDKKEETVDGGAGGGDGEVGHMVTLGMRSEKELNEGTLVVYLSISFCWRAAPPRMSLARAIFRNLSISTLHACVHAWAKKKNYDL
jgi:hypothetical protein